MHTHTHTQTVNSGSPGGRGQSSMVGSVAFPISPAGSLSLLVSGCPAAQDTSYKSMSHTAPRPHDESITVHSSPSLSPLIPGPLLSSLQLLPGQMSSRTLLFSNVQPLWQDSFAPDFLEPPIPLLLLVLQNPALGSSAREEKAALVSLRL